MIRRQNMQRKKQDFIHKFMIAKKANEVVYCLELKATDYLNEKKNMKI
jgi:hypothetical protein